MFDQHILSFVEKIVIKAIKQVTCEMPMNYTKCIDA